jgi:hypothetical protein
VNASSARLSRLCLAPLLLALPAPGLAQERTREFPAQKCRYTLPAEGWEWLEPPRPEAVFMAGSRGEVAVTLICAPLPTPKPRHADWLKFVEGAKRGLYQPGQLEKRGEGHFLTFQGLPAFQAEGTFAGGKTMATRVFVAHGRSYQLLVVGGEAAVEQRPDFEAIMGEFAFTEPPAPPEPPDGPEGSVYYRLGRLAGYCLMGAVALAAILWGSRRRKAPPHRGAGGPGAKGREAPPD